MSSSDTFVPRSITGRLHWAPVSRSRLWIHSTLQSQISGFPAKWSFVRFSARCRKISLIFLKRHPLKLTSSRLNGLSSLVPLPNASIFRVVRLRQLSRLILRNLFDTDRNESCWMLFRGTMLSSSSSSRAGKGGNVSESMCLRIFPPKSRWFTEMGISGMPWKALDRSTSLDIDQSSSRWILVKLHLATSRVLRSLVIPV